jgi:hypothetical protein
MDGNRFVSVELTCRRPHPGDHLASAVNVDTQRSDLPDFTFDDAWSDHWLSGEHWDRTELVDGADGHRTVIAECPTCPQVVKIRESTLRALLRELWAPSAWRSTTWPPR